jgi:hypothetical protein
VTNTNLQSVAILTKVWSIRKHLQQALGMTKAAKSREILVKGYPLDWSRPPEIPESALSNDSVV